MSKQLFIPETVRVGFQDRQGTYNGRLAYVIYYDNKKVLRKKKSWESWRSKNIDPIDLNNVPTDGFVLNKKVGGYKSDWNYRSAHIRVYDPRGFEFEISVENLLFILSECDCSRGKGLEGQFVYSWQGTDLILLPVSSESYKNSQNFTKLQGQSIKAKELVKGYSYNTKDQQVLVYLGKFDYHKLPGGWKEKNHLYKKFVFHDGKFFVFMDNIKKVASINSEVVAPNYAELVEKYYKSTNGSKIVSFVLKENKEPITHDYYDTWFAQDGDVFKEFRRESENVIEKYYEYSLVDGIPVIKYDRVYSRRPGTQTTSYSSNYYYGYGYDGKWCEPTNLKLWAVLESGSEYMCRHSSLVENSNG